MTINEAAKSLGVCARTIIRMMDRGELPHVRAGKLRRIDAAAFEEILRKRRQPLTGTEATRRLGRIAHLRFRLTPVGKGPGGHDLFDAAEVDAFHAAYLTINAGPQPAGDVAAAARTLGETKLTAAAGCFPPDKLIDGRQLLKLLESAPTMTVNTQHAPS